MHKVIRPDNANPKDAVGRTTVVFDSEATANQAFAAIAGNLVFSAQLTFIADMMHF